MVNISPKVTVSEGRVGPRVYVLDDCVTLGELSMELCLQKTEFRFCSYDLTV